VTVGADLILRDVRPFGGPSTDIAILNGHITAMAPALPHLGPSLDGGGRDIIPGLHDHHLHLFATAAQAESVDLSNLKTANEIQTALRTAAAGQRIGAWLRATGLVEPDGTLPDRALLDQWVPDRPLRIQGRTGGLWLLNSLALDQIGPAPWPSSVECDGSGRPTGRIWRGDEWLRQAIGGQPPSLAKVSRALASHGITAITDASSTNGPAEAQMFEDAIVSGQLLQKLTLMGREDLPRSTLFKSGPLKLLYDENALPPLEAVTPRIHSAREQGRSVAAHCVTLCELLFFLGALDEAGGPQTGDRIEHGSVIPHSLLPDIAKSGLMIVTQPDFVRTRGDRYLKTIESYELPDLYRLKSLKEAGIDVAAGSDAPYGSMNPWSAIHSAIHRTTSGGQSFGKTEALSAGEALALFVNSRRIFPGMPADLCLLNRPISTLAERHSDSPIAMTLVGGHVIYER
jgi:predicted amidohydrolase YtcJ